MYIFKNFKRVSVKILIAWFFLIESYSHSAEVSITMDDPSLEQEFTMSSKEKNKKILKSLSKHNAKAVLFVCGKRVDSPQGKTLLKSWVKKGHLLGNHSYSHESYNMPDQTFEVFSKDIIDGEKVIINFDGFYKVFRFPYLKEGDTAEKRDLMRAFLKKNNYKQGYVTIDASDWYINDRLIERLKKNPNTDLKPYRDYYLKHIWERAQYYNSLSLKLLGREVKHTLLVHHNLLNALFLDDLLSMFKKQGWKIISAKSSYQDPIVLAEPKIIPAGESILWGLAKEKGTFESELRYPAESDEYEKEEMDRLNL